MKAHGQSGEPKKSTIVERYIRRLYDLGLSLQDLKILGKIDLSEEDKKLTERELVEKILTDDNYKEEKEVIEKYISEFVRADLISQQIHRRRGEALVKSGDEDKVDGGVYLYRTRQNTTGINGSDVVQVEENEYIKEVGEKEYVQMKYMPPDEFQALVKSQNSLARYRYTVDEETEELIIANVQTIETITINVTDNDNTKRELEAVVTTQNVDYRQFIEKYTMPYEFLMTLCEITQNPEFVYHVSLLARETKIILAVQDNTTEEKVTIRQKNKYESYENSNNNSTSEASKTGEREEEIVTITNTITTDPHLQIEYANTWSFYEEWEYTKSIESYEEKKGPETETFELGATLGNYQEGGYVTHDNPQGGGYGHMTYESEKWYDTFKVETQTETETQTKVSKYNPGILKNSVEKSKQFLGLLRNETGKCEHNCYEDKEQAIKCVKDAVFDRNGLNVEYRLPNSTGEDDPLRNLQSGLDMFYNLLGEGQEGNENIPAEEDYESQYKVRMSGMIDHMKYLMTFPDNEDVEIKYETDEEDQIEIGYDPVQYDDINEEDLEILYKICEAEAGGSSEAEIGHVACVILNRVKCSKWPSTIKEVVFQPHQFSPVSNGSYQKANPSEKTKRAVNSVLASGDTTGGAVYFRTEKSAKDAGMPTSKDETHSTYIYLFTDPNTHVFLTDSQSLEELRGTTGGTSPATGKLADLFPNGIPTTRDGIQEYLTTIQVPITKKDGTKTTANVTVHRGIAEELKSVLAQAQDAGFKVYEVQGFSWRAVSGTTKMSQHSLGLAVDINVKENYCVYPNGKVDAGSYWKPGEDEYSIPSDGVLVNAFKSIGWGWGGDWSSKKDYMHFSYTGK